MIVTSWVDITRTPPLQFQSSYIHDLRARGGGSEAILISNTSEILNGCRLAKVTSRVIACSPIVIERYYAILPNGMYRLIAVRYRSAVMFDTFIGVTLGFNRFKTDHPERVATPFAAMLTYLARLHPAAYMDLGSHAALMEYGNFAREFASCPANASMVWYDVDHVLSMLADASHPAGGIDHGKLSQTIGSITSHISGLVSSQDVITLEHRWRDVESSEFRLLGRECAFDVTLPPPADMTTVTHVNPQWATTIADDIAQVPFTDFSITAIIKAGTNQVLPTFIDETVFDRYAMHFAQCAVSLTRDQYYAAIYRLFTICFNALLTQYGRAMGMPKDMYLTISKSYDDTARIVLDTDCVDGCLLDIRIDLLYMAIFGQGIAVDTGVTKLVQSRDLNSWV